MIMRIIMEICKFLKSDSWIISLFFTNKFPTWNIYRKGILDPWYRVVLLLQE